MHQAHSHALELLRAKTNRSVEAERDSEMVTVAIDTEQEKMK